MRRRLVMGSGRRASHLPTAPFVVVGTVTVLASVSIAVDGAEWASRSEAAQRLDLGRDGGGGRKARLPTEDKAKDKAKGAEAEAEEAARGRRRRRHSCRCCGDGRTKAAAAAAAAVQRSGAHPPTPRPIWKSGAMIAMAAAAAVTAAAREEAGRRPRDRMSASARDGPSNCR
mmetsp:Transcript_22102/g.44722  ORF Transcript_22102/g.44722 Transcript_22102/m.44722 type:complete len:172 (-) Transcript_22102:53-568(-)